MCVRSCGSTVVADSHLQYKKLLASFLQQASLFDPAFLNRDRKSVV